MYDFMYLSSPSCMSTLPVDGTRTRVGAGVGVLIIVLSVVVMLILAVVMVRRRAAYKQKRNGRWETIPTIMILSL